MRQEVCDERFYLGREHLLSDDKHLNSPVNYSLRQELYRAEEAKRILRVVLGGLSRCHFSDPNRRLYHLHCACPCQRVDCRRGD